MVEPSWCALTSTPSMAPSPADVTRPARAMVDVCADAELPGAGMEMSRSAPRRRRSLRNMGTDSPRTQTCSLPPCGGGNMLQQMAQPHSSRSADRLLLHHQAVDLDRRIGVVRELSPGGALQLEALGRAGDLDVGRVDVLAEAGEPVVALRVGAGDQGRVAALDLRRHLGVGE